MQVKKYRAATMTAALEMVKKELGTEALIIETREVKKKGIARLFSAPVVEVTAALEEEKPEITKTQNVAINKEYAPSSTSKQTSEITLLKEMIEELKKETALQSLKNDSKATDSIEPISTIRSKLINTGMSYEAADSILMELIYQGVDLRSAQSIDVGIRQALKKVIKVGVPQQNKKPYIIFLVGTTGVGKTTTLGKLAAKYHLVNNLKVGLITIDTYRIAAVEQLKTYAEIINIPIEVAFSAEDYAKSLKRYADMDIILVDTAGRSQNNMIQVGEIRDFLADQMPDEMHLVISATTKLEDCSSILAAFLPLGVTHIIYSKADETLSHGALLDIMQMSNLPISYIADGQRVPEDLALAEMDNIVEMILEG